MEKMAITVRELSGYLGISLPKAYELVASKGFPVIHVGSRKIIPMDAFKRWLDEESARTK